MIFTEPFIPLLGAVQRRLRLAALLPTGGLGAGPEGEVRHLAGAGSSDLLVKTLQESLGNWSTVVLAAHRRPERDGSGKRRQRLTGRRRAGAAAIAPASRNAADR